MVFSCRSCRSSGGSEVAFWKSVSRCSKTQVSRVDASGSLVRNVVQESSIKPAHASTFCKVFVVLIVGPRVDPARYGTMGKYGEDIWRSKRERCT